jgi:hypothetical protein
MFRKNTAVTFAVCAALAACDGSTPGRDLTAPEPGSALFSATATDAVSTPYAWGDDALGPSAIARSQVEADQAATGGRATGDWRLPAPFGNRAAEHYSFTALSTGPLAAAKGEIQLHTTFVGDVESNVHLDVDCLVIVGNQAWFSGPATRWTLGGIPQPPGLYLLFRVVDNGEGANDPADLGSPAFSGPPMGCRLMPPFPLLPSANGNIQVRQR